MVLQGFRNQGPPPPSAGCAWRFLMFERGLQLQDAMPKPLFAPPVIPSPCLPVHCVSPELDSAHSAATLGTTAGAAGARVLSPATLRRVSWSRHPSRPCLHLIMYHDAIVEPALDQGSTPKCELAHKSDSCGAVAGHEQPCRRRIQSPRQGCLQSPARGLLAV